MDILLKADGDLYISPDGDIALENSVAQKIKIKLKWFEGEWKWDQEEGLPYFTQLMVKNPDTDLFESLVREKIFEVDEVTDVKDVSVTFSSRKRTAHISYVAYTDTDVIRGEVDLNCLIME